MKPKTYRQQLLPTSVRVNMNKSELTTSYKFCVASRENSAVKNDQKTAENLT